MDQMPIRFLCYNGCANSEDLIEDVVEGDFSHRNASSFCYSFQLTVNKSIRYIVQQTCYIYCKTRQPEIWFWEGFCHLGQVGVNQFKKFAMEKCSRIVLDVIQQLYNLK